MNHFQPALARRRSPVEGRRAARERRAPRCPRSSRPASGTWTSTASRFRRSPVAPSIVGGVFVTAAGFVSDAITIGDRLTINAGLRFDHSRAISQDLPRSRRARTRNRRHRCRAWARSTRGTCGRRGWGHDEADGRWPHDAARELRPLQSGRARPASWRRSILAAATTITTALRSGDRRLHHARVHRRSRKNLQLDPDMRTPRTDEYSIGVDRAARSPRCRWRSPTSAKDGGNFIGWTDVGGSYREDTRVAAGRSQRARVRARRTRPPTGDSC